MKRRNPNRTLIILLCGAATCFVAGLQATATAVEPADFSSFILDVPGDTPEWIAATKDIPALEALSRNKYLSIMGGYQAILKGSRIPIAPASHVPWAKPYARGPVKVLAITAAGIAKVDTRQIAQVARELDSDMRFVLIAHIGVGREEEYDEGYRNFLAEQAREALEEEYDVILYALGSIKPNKGEVLPPTFFPEDVYETIKEKVRQGTGVVFTGAKNSSWWGEASPLEEILPATRTGAGNDVDSADIELKTDSNLLTGTPLKNLPRFNANTWEPRKGAEVVASVDGQPLVLTGTYGKGRTLLLGWANTLSPVNSIHLNRLQFEHGMAIALRGVAWAAKLPPPVAVWPQDTRLEAGQPGNAMVKTSGPGQLHCTLRDTNFRSLHDAVVTSTGGDTAVPLPSIPAGRYWLDVIARDENGASLGWGSGLVEAEAEAGLNLQIETDVYEVGDTVQLAGTLEPVPEGATLGFSVVDAAGRELATGTAPGTNRFSFEYDVADVRVPAHTIRVTCYKDGAPWVTETTKFFVPIHGWEDYHNILWPEAKNNPENEVMRDVAGITAIMGQYEMSEAAAMTEGSGIRQARMNAAPLHPNEVQLDPVSGTTNYDPRLVGAIETSRKYGAVCVALQDERHMVKDPGMPSEDGILRYRRYLKDEYGSIEALNRQWETTHPAWSHVLPTLTADLTPQTTNLAPWVDFRLFVADEIHQTDIRRARWVRDELGEETYVGIDGFTTSNHMIPYGGTDIARLLTTGVFNFYCPYDDDLMISSMVQGRNVIYIASTMTRNEYFGLPWRGLFRGHAGAFRYNGRTYFSQFGWVQPPGNWIEEGSRELRHGIGRLLIGAERQFQSVAFLYSYPSILATAAAGQWVNPKNTHLMWYPGNQSRLTLEHMLLKCGISAFRYLTADQVGAGHLKDVKFLIIPHLMGMALSDETCRAIEAFVKDGGLVMADLAPAVCDEHGTPRERGGLNDLFGITREHLAYTHGEGDYTIRTTVKDPLVPENAWFTANWFEKEVRATEGTALGRQWFVDAPAFISKDSGKGRAILLNMLLPSIVPRKGELDRYEVELMDRLIQVAGIKPWATIETRAGISLQQNYEVNRFKDDGTEYIGIYCSKSPENPGSVVVRFSDARHTYDVRRGQYLGVVDVAPVPIRGFDGALFARCDDRIEGIAIRTADAAPGEKVNVRVKLNGAVTGRQVVRLEVTEPNGKRNFFYTRNVDLQDGQFRGSIHTALNDAQGKWTVRARDVISGMDTEATFRLE